MNSIFARLVTVLHKNGLKTEYTHVTKMQVIPNDTQLGHTVLYIKGETDDVDGSRCITIDKLPIKDLHLTIIDWYIPVE